MADEAREARERNGALEAHVRPRPGVVGERELAATGYETVLLGSLYADLRRGRRPEDVTEGSVGLLHAVAAGALELLFARHDGAGLRQDRFEDLPADPAVLVVEV